MQKEKSENSLEEPEIMSKASFGKKKISRIGLQMSKSKSIGEIREYDELYRGELEDNEYSKSENLEMDPIINIEVNIMFPENKIPIYSLCIQVLKSTKVKEVIKEAINEYNKRENEVKIGKKNFVIELINLFNKYYLKPSRKNKMPKDDYPPYDYEISLSDCSRTNFSLLINDSECVMYKKTRNAQKCQKCTIF